MGKFIIGKSPRKNNHWLCIDKENDFACEFEHQKFSDTQVFMIKKDIKRPDDETLACLFDELEDWLYENHYEKTIDVNALKEKFKDLDNDDDDDD